jgi:hypothetical protein
MFAILSLFTFTKSTRQLASTLAGSTHMLVRSSALLAALGCVTPAHHLPTSIAMRTFPGFALLRLGRSSTSTSAAT